MNTTQVPSVQDTRNRRTPYHQRDSYMGGDTPKKAKIIRTSIMLGHPITTEGFPVLDARSVNGLLVLKINGKNGHAWVSTPPLFHYFPKTS